MVFHRVGADGNIDAAKIIMYLHTMWRYNNKVMSEYFLLIYLGGNCADVGLVVVGRLNPILYRFAVICSV